MWESTLHLPRTTQSADFSLIKWRITRCIYKAFQATPHVQVKRNHLFLYKYSSAPVSKDNTFQDLKPLRENADNTERYI
jgi:hypothetical protein